MQNKTINGFTLQRQLGTGGMAEVWYAENEIGMKAAVKILSKELSLNEQMQERFLNEAKVMVRLDHPNIRKVYGYGTIDDRPAIIMEYLDGMDLKTRLKRGQRFSDEDLRKWWNQLVDALKYTHSLNIVHRDIKPSNIFVDQKGNAKLLDFGIAKVADTTTGTLTGSTLGTRIYMSPEQVKDPKRVGTASDVYSLAVSFVHLLTGKAPYESTTSSDYDIQLNIVSKPLDLSRVSTGWQAFLEPYLAKEPLQRPGLKRFPQTQATVPGDDDSTLAEGSEPRSNTKLNEQRSSDQRTSRANKPAKAGNSLFWKIISAAAVVALLVVLLFGNSNGKPEEKTEGKSDAEEVVPNPIPDNDYSYDEISAKVFAESGYLLSGQTYKAQAMVTAWQNSRITAMVSLDGGAQKEYTSDAQGVINLEYNCGVGSHRYNGIIKMLDPKSGEIKDYPFENSFTVAPPAVSVSATKMNVVYRGINNPIAVGGGVGGEISASASSGSLTRTGNGTYNLLPGAADEVTISVTSGGSSLGSMKFRVKDLPKPTAFIRNVVNGRASKSALLAAGRVEAEMKDFDFDGVHYDVVGYTFLYKTKSGTIKEVKANSGSFTDEIRAAISSSNVDDMFAFTDIQVRGDDGKVKTFGTPIGIVIK